jgi:hypothetical protein
LLSQAIPAQEALPRSPSVSLAATAGSQIARGIVDAMLEWGIKVVFVTRMYDLAHSLFRRGKSRHTFSGDLLGAERRTHTVRSFRMAAGAPETTSYGEDSLRRVFGLPDAPQAGDCN